MSRPSRNLGLSICGGAGVRTDDPFDLSEHYAQRGRLLQELGALRDFARLRNRREWQWRRLADPDSFKAYLRERKYAWQR